MSHQPPYPVAIVGLGRIAWKLEKDSLREKPATHVGAIFEEPRLQLVAGLDRDEGARDGFHREYQVPVFSDFDTMLGEVHPDFLVIATHPDSHLQYLRKAVEARIPLILCEKPLGMVEERFSPLLNRAQRLGLRIMVNHERRYSRDWQAARTLIESDELGRPLSFYARISMGRTRDPTSVLFWDGTHMLDALRFLFPGSWKVLDRWSGKKSCGKLVAQLQFGSVCGILDVSSGYDHLVFELEVQFTAGRLRIGNGIWEVWHSQPSPFYEGFRSLVRREERVWSTTNYFRGVMTDAADCLEDPSRKPLSTGRDGWEALKIIRTLLGVH